MDAIKENFQKIVSEAKKDGVRVELLIAGGENISIGYQKRKLDSFESTQSQVAGFRVIDGANQGYAYTENLSDESLLRAYKEAFNNAKTVESKTKFEIPLTKPGQKIQALDVNSAEDIPMDEKLAVAQKLEEYCLDADKRIQAVPYSGFDQSTSFKRILNSEGLDQEFKQSYYTGYSYALAKDGESSKMDGEGFFARRFKDIDVKEVTQTSVEKAISRLGAVKPETGHFPVVIDRTQFPMVIAMFRAYLSAQEVDEGKSLFEGKLGQKVASDKFTLIDDPFETRGSAVRPFDDEGSPTQKTVLFENGVLKNFLTNIEYSKKMNLPHTSSAARSPASPMGIGATNLVVAKGTKSLEDLLKKYPKVIHMTEFSGGLHAGYKDTTGDISMPAEGFLYENGKKVAAIDQFVMSGNVLDLLRDIEELSNEYNREGSSTICPDVLVKSMSFAGK
ncbi:peptidase [Bdellovibrio bacteriovorus]|uniref:Peptidase n=1 Tax=Bdellovibrio bacteriovorus TaxID=959 RepID=A0A150WED5_BDEBC|nr:TldD/PmbA family protein [Bdellovibrio bacteriovorus]KYG61457.1 peptidase [Bdellovibrio bacteriovorus]